MEKRFIFEPPYFDLRVVTIILCLFLSGLYAAAHMDVHLAVHGSGNIILPLAVSFLRYAVLTLLCMASVRFHACIVLLFLYDAVCAVVFGFFCYCFFCFNSIVLLSVILPMLIYCYVMTVFSSAVFLPKVDLPFAENTQPVYNKGRFFRILVCRWRIILFAVLLEGVVAPCI